MTGQEARDLTDREVEVGVTSEGHVFMQLDDEHLFIMEPHGAVKLAETLIDTAKRARN